MSKLNVTTGIFMEVEGSHFENADSLFDAFIAYMQNAGNELKLEVKSENNTIYSYCLDAEALEPFKVKLLLKKTYSSIHFGLEIEGGYNIPESVHDACLKAIADFETVVKGFISENYFRKEERSKDSYVIETAYDTDFVLDVMEDFYGVENNAESEIGSLYSHFFMGSFQIQNSDKKFDYRHLTFLLYSDHVSYRCSSYGREDDQPILVNLARVLRENTPSTKVPRDRTMKFSKEKIALQGSSLKSADEVMAEFRECLGNFGAIVRIDDSSFKVILENEEYPEHETSLVIKSEETGKNTVKFEGTYYLTGRLIFDDYIVKVMKGIHGPIEKAVTDFGTEVLLPKREACDSVEIKGAPSDFVEFLIKKGHVENEATLEYRLRTNTISPHLEIEGVSASLDVSPGLVKFYIHKDPEGKFFEAIMDLTEEFNSLYASVDSE